MAAADVVHVQNVMNPTALTRLVSSGRAVVTVQDHRVFCPGPGRTPPDRETRPTEQVYTRMLVQHPRFYPPCSEWVKEY